MRRKIWTSLLIEFGPIFVFFGVSHYLSFVLATLIFVIATALAFSVSIIERKKIAWFPVLVAGSVLAFGGATVIFDNPSFIIFKDTLYNGILAAILAGGLLLGKAFMKPLFDGLFAMNDRGWRTLTWRWMWMFIILTIGNEVARHTLSAHGWIDYKIITTLLTTIFSLLQFPLARRERLSDASPWGFRI
jgi:intracellular septation protein